MKTEPQPRADVCRALGFPFNEYADRYVPPDRYKEAIRVKIAELDGIKNPITCGCPNYPHDLNAVHDLLSKQSEVFKRWFCGRLEITRQERDCTLVDLTALDWCEEAILTSTQYDVK